MVSWNVTLPPGSTLVVKAQDFYSQSYPDYWYIELSDENGRITRSVAFPNTNNAPVKGVVPSGNATVLIRYFDGKERFPAKVSVQFESITPPKPQLPPQINTQLSDYCHLFCFLGDPHCNYCRNDLAAPSEKQENIKG